MSEQHLNIYLAKPDRTLDYEYKRINKVLIRAGLKVYTLHQEGESYIQTFVEEFNKILHYCQSSIHLIGDEYDYVPELKMSFTEFQINRALEYSKDKPFFRVFVWRPGYLDAVPKSQEQKNLWFSLRNKISSNIIVLTHDNPILVAEDIRTVMNVEEMKKIETEKTEIYLMYNEIDEPYAMQIIDLLQDVAKVTYTEISLNSDLEYEQYIVEQIKDSVLPVIYFRKASSWATFFIQQVWRLIGGASSDKTILFIGDDEVSENLDIKFEPTNVQTIITSFDIVPLEIKVQLDKIKEKEQI